MSTAVDISSLIVSSPQIRQGRPRIAGTGLPVMRIAQCHNLGLLPDESAANFGHLSLAQVHAALAYHHANRDEIDTEISEEAAAADELKRLHATEQTTSR